MGLSFRSAEERAQFAERLAQGRDEDASREEQRTANRDFSQVYPKGWTRIRALLNESSLGLRCSFTRSSRNTWTPMAGPLWWIKKRCAKPWAFSRTTLWRAIIS